MRLEDLSGFKLMFLFGICLGVLVFVFLNRRGLLDVGRAMPADPLRYELYFVGQCPPCKTEV